MNYPKSFQSKKYPKFIQNSLVLKAYPKTEKIFPKIGLPNNECSVKSLKTSQIAETTNFVRQSLIALEALAALLIKNNDNNNLLTSINQIYHAFANNDYEIKQTGKFSTIQPYNSFESKDLIESIKRIIAHVNKTYPTNKQLLRLFSEININLTPSNCSALLPFKNKNIKMVFSSDGDRGAWDIATMSMRKISSCMRWASGHSTALIGSISDPYCGVIYLTDGTKTKLGTNMLARSVVRLVVDRKNKPVLFLERAYPKSFSNADFKKIMSIFLSYFASKVKLPVQFSFGDGDGEGRYKRPITETVKTILNNFGDYQYENEQLSMSDAYLAYKDIPQFANPKKVKIKTA